MLNLKISIFHASTRPGINGFNCFHGKMKDYFLMLSMPNKAYVKSVLLTTNNLSL